ncbi:MAG: HK97 family phage prohead protease, partial [Gemmatimonadales bacterium]|nr:HK97 family phage prohead protease [Gemmatimonadales bacterium]
ALAERGDIGGASFGFIATAEDWKGDLREIRGVELHEISVVQSWPAYEQTEINVRHRTPQVLIFGQQWLETCR